MCQCESNIHSLALLHEFSKGLPLKIFLLDLLAFDITCGICKHSQTFSVIVSFFLCHSVACPMLQSLTCSEEAEEEPIGGPTTLPPRPMNETEVLKSYVFIQAYSKVIISDLLH